MDLKLGGHERLELYAEAVVQMSTNPHIPQLFRDIFKDAFLPYRSPETLSLFLKEINSFTYDHSEDLGDAFEYLLSIMGSQGDAGQFRTPRHIIDFIVAVVDPKKDETILDPACGTAGFLISAYKHILKQHDGLDDPDHKEKPLTPDEKKKLMGNLFGYDISPDMVKLSKVNMYLHGFAEPKIFEYDTLSSDEKWDEMYDVIMANPPFMSPKGGIRPHKRFSVQANRAEVLFVDYIKEHLRPNGRAGVIVPEGIIFKNDVAYKQLRKLLVEDGLFAVVSLPSGVFNPYAGVKTSILFFDNSLAKIAKNILFVKINNDGYDLGAQRREVEGSDLPRVLKLFKKYIDFIKTNKTSKDLGLDFILENQDLADLFVLQPNDFHPAGHHNLSNEKAWELRNKLSEYFQTIEKNKISESGDYNLSGDRYKEIVTVGIQKWPLVELGETCIFEYGKPLKQENRKTGEYPVYGSNGIVGYHNEYLVKGPFVIIGRKGTAGAVTYSEKSGFPIDTTFYVKLLDEKKVNLKYLYFILRTLGLDKINTQAGVPGLNRNDAYKLKIPLPPIVAQDEIVKEIEGYQKNIIGAKQIIDNWKPQIDIDLEWEKVRFGEIFKRSNSQVDPTKQTGEVFYVGLEKIESGTGHILNFKRTKYSDIKSLKNSFLKGSILYGKLRPNLNKVWLADREGICSTDILVLVPTDKAMPDFYSSLMLSDKFVEEVMKGIKGAQLPRVGFEHLQNIIVPSPSLEIQQQVVAQIEAQQDFINRQEALIQICERKIEWKISQVWQNLPHFNDLFLGANVEDEFGWSSQWNEEIEKWLSFIELKDNNYYKTHRNRAKNPKQRDELLGEYKAAYFIEERANGRIIEFEPQASGLYKYDFSFTDKVNKEWMVEVKSPSWRGVVSKEIDDKFMLELRGGMAIIGGEKYPECKTEMKCLSCGEVFEFIVSNIEDKESTNEELKKLICPKCKKNLWNSSEQERAKEKAKRLSLPQFINAEGRWLGFDIFEEAIVNSLNKFEAGKNNLLILCPNSFAEMGFFGALENWHHLREMVKRLDKDKKLTCIGVFEVSLSGEFKYHCSLVDIKGHPSLNDDATIYLDSRK